MRCDRCAEGRDKRDHENDTPRGPKVEITLQNWEDTPVLTDVSGPTNGQSRVGQSKCFIAQE